MFTPTVSVVVATFRPGGLDILFAGMKRQLFRDYELIVVDRRWERRHEQVVALAKSYGVPIIHVPEHRRNGKWISFCSAWNTGLALSRGEYIIICQDWACPIPQWIDSHLEGLDGHTDRYVLAPYVYTQLPKVTFKSVVSVTPNEQMARGDCCVTPDPVLEGHVLDEMYPFVEGPFQTSWIPKLPPLAMPDQDSRFASRGIIADRNWIHFKNESAHRSVFEKLSGLDERLERGKGPMDLDFGMRLRYINAHLWWEPAALAFSPNARFLCRTMPWGHMTERLEGRWSYADGLAYIERRKKEIENGGPVASKNPYQWDEFCRRLAPWRYGIFDPLPQDITDETYWQREIWPESE